MSTLTVNMQSFTTSNLFLPSSAYAYPVGEATASSSAASATSGSYDQWSRWLRSSMRSRRSLLLDQLDYRAECGMKKPTMLNGQPQQQKPVETAPQQHQYQHQQSFCFRQQETVEDAEQDAFCTRTCSSELSRGIFMPDDSSNSTTATTSLKRKCRQHEGADDSLLHEQCEILKQIQRENQGRQQHEAEDQPLPTPMAAAAASSMSCSSSSAVSGVSVSLSSSVSSSSMERKVKAKPTTQPQTKRPVVEVLAADVAQRGEKTALFQCPACRQMLTIDRSIPVVYCPTCQSCSRTDW